LHAQIVKPETRIHLGSTLYYLEDVLAPVIGTMKVTHLRKDKFDCFDQPLRLVCDEGIFVVVQAGVYRLHKIEILLPVFLTLIPEVYANSNTKGISIGCCPIHGV
jgi:hypothetical protein